MAVYAAQVERMDVGIGWIIDALKKRSVLDDTVVMFLSDNGGCAELLKEDGDYDFVVPETVDHRPVAVGNHPSIDPGPDDTFMSYDLPWANVSNSPFRLFKHWVHEGGISTPFILHWRERIPAGAIVHSPVHLIDIMATIVEITGAKYPKEYHGRSIFPLEGESLLPATADSGWERVRPLFWEHEGNLAVRDGHWKLVRRYPGAWELYDMESDRTELVDLSEGNQRVVARLEKSYLAWAERCGVVPWEEMTSRLETLE
jgi:arylsulfatase